MNLVLWIKIIVGIMSLKELLTTGNVDYDKKSVYDVKDKEVGSLKEIIRPLEEGEKGNDQSRDEEGLIILEMDNTPEKRIRRKPVTRNSDFYGRIGV
jgi:hypothetical protein